MRVSCVPSGCVDEKNKKEDTDKEKTYESFGDHKLQREEQGNYR